MTNAAKADAARAAAVAALVRVHRGGFANLSANTALAAPGLTPQGRAFAGAVFYTAAERLVTLDFILAPFLKRPPEKLDVELRAILECGACQMLYMRVPPRAAVDESVKLARAFGKSSAAGLVNAVLRRAAGANTDFSAYPFASEVERVRVQWSVGAAAARAVIEALPESYDAFFAASFAGPETCLRVNTLKNSAETLLEKFAERGVAVRRGQLENALYARLPGAVTEEPLFCEGRYHVQGEASQYACACLRVKPGQKVLDLCAAPGGKSAVLAQGLCGGAGLCACDVRQNRLPLVEKALRRLGIEGARLLLNDGTVFNGALCGQDAVLCDAPCSGLGVLAKKPDLRFCDGNNFKALPALQLKLLAAAARYVKKGGRLVYSTCTVRREENAGVVRDFLNASPNFRLVKPAAAPEGALCGPYGMMLWPHLTGLDGFFIASMERL